MQARKYVTVSQRRNGWRVSAKQSTGDLNRMDIQLAERMCRTEAAARRVAQEYARDYGAEVLN